MKVGIGTSVGAGAGNAISGGVGLTITVITAGRAVTMRVTGTILVTSMNGGGSTKTVCTTITGGSTSLVTSLGGPTTSTITVCTTGGAERSCNLDDSGDYNLSNPNNSLSRSGVDRLAETASQGRNNK